MAREASKQTVDRLLELLYQELSSSPRKLRRVTTAAGVNRNYPVERKAAGTMDLAKLCALVEANGEDFASFVARALAPEGGSDLLERPEGEEPAILEKARRRAGEETPGSIPRSHLEALDDLRYDDPAKAREGVEAAISFIEPVDVPFALGVYASCCRPLLLFDEATHAISCGIAIARQLDQPRMVANLIQRASIALYVQTRYPEALAASECAALHYARLGDAEGLAQTLVDQGPMLWELNRYVEAERAFRTALDSLPEHATRNRWACYLALALIPYHEGEHAEALEALAKARPLAHSKAEEGKIRWLEGCCLAELNRRAEALSAFQEGFALLANTVPIDAALLTCDRVRHLLRWGRRQDAHDGAKALRPLLFPLQERSLSIAAAARELANIEWETRTELTLQFVEAVKDQIEEASGTRSAGFARPPKAV